MKRPHGTLGTSMQGSWAQPYNFDFAMKELHFLGKKPKYRKDLDKKHRKLNIQKMVESGKAQTEVRYVLMEYGPVNRQIKAKVMTRFEAYRRNKALQGTGFAWAQCS